MALINALLGLGDFLDNLETSFVVPIYKSSETAKLSNYRLTVIKSALCKVFDTG